MIRFVSELQITMKTYFTSSKLQVTLLTALFLSFGWGLRAQGGTSVSTAPSTIIPTNGVAPATIFSGLAQEEELSLTIKADFATLLANKNLDDYQEADLSYAKNGQSEDLKVKVRVRGKSRRRACDFPPLKVKFDKEGLAASGFSTQFKSLKLVTHWSTRRRGGSKIC